LAQVWQAFTDPQAVVRWNAASEDWHTPSATSDLRVGGSFVYRMEAKDGSFSFDFTGVYTEVVSQEKIVYVMEDGRQVTVTFAETAEGVLVVETFDPETENSLELQKTGWQAILQNFKQYVEKQVV
jgi:uncharacterized protein YndB with AHSA1/START domain